MAPHDLEFDVTTLLFMPHCPRSLFDDLLRTGWSRRKLRRLVILGNRLDMYDDPTHPSATLSAKAPFIVKSLPLWSIHPLPTNRQHFDVFNDLALQWIPYDVLIAQPPELWDFNAIGRARVVGESLLVGNQTGQEGVEEEREEDRKEKLYEAERRDSG